MICLLTLSQRLIEQISTRLPSTSRFCDIRLSRQYQQSIAGYGSGKRI
jgi:hypothetical protein